MFFFKANSSLNLMFVNLFLLPAAAGASFFSRSIFSAGLNELPSS